MRATAPTPRSAESSLPVPSSGPGGPERLRIGLRTAGIEQGVRLAWCAALVAAAALIGACADPFRPPAKRASARKRREQAALRRVVTTLGALKGVFAKAGQFAAVRHDLLPAPVTNALGSLRDRVPPLEFERIRGVVEAELGAPLESLFAAFDKAPLGAASIAQAHEARLHSGQRVVVKVQYPWLQASLETDLAWVRWGMRLWAGRGIDATRLFDEFASGVASELDFEHEAAIAEEIAANLSADSQVVVPAPVRSHTSRRVLTMDHHRAVAIADRDRLAEIGVEPDAIVEIVARAYAKQVFVDGLFHADPHPGNLLVLDEPEASVTPRVLFIDFGLSRRLSPELRRELRLALFALIQRDVDAFVDGVERLGMIAPEGRAGVHAAVSHMFERVAAAGGALGSSGDRMLALKNEAKVLLQQTPGLQLRADLLLYAKTVAYVFALGADIAPGVDVMKLSLPYVLNFLGSAEPVASAPLNPASGAGPAAG